MIENKKFVINTEEVAVAIQEYLLKLGKITQGEINNSTFVVHGVCRNGEIAQQTFEMRIVE